MRSRLAAWPDDLAARELRELLAQHPRAREADLPEVRVTWWRLRRAGAPLPAEPGTIVIDGGRR